MIRWYQNPDVKNSFDEASLPLLNTLDDPQAQIVRAYHRSIPGYVSTPLVSLQHWAQDLGVGDILIKDESYRFDLKAFKILGASYAIGRFLQSSGYPLKDPLHFLRLREILYSIPEPERPTLVTATDGNHGRAVAWMAQRLRCPARIFLPQQATKNRIDAIRSLGAECTVTNWGYDETVDFARREARRHGWTLIQDTAREGYEDIPAWIMEGYLTLMVEIREQMRVYEHTKPTHIFLQSGVGSFAAAIAGYCEQEWSENRPRIIVVEPAKAACLYHSIKHQNRTASPGTAHSFMAGLSCGTLSTLAWPLLRHTADWVITCHDDLARHGMRRLAKPIKGDAAIISGESGAVTAGLLHNMQRDKKAKILREMLELDEDSIVLLFNTEGDTDPDVYTRTVRNR